MSTRLSIAAVALLAAAAAAIATTSMHGAEAVSIRATPGISFAPADVTINAMVEPNAANRAIDVVVDSGEYFRRSAAGLDGDRAARTNQFRFPRLPAGVYQIRVTVKGASGKALGSAIAEIRVIDGEADVR